jgi:anti-sigma factor (TIGR02949 family)
MTGLSCEQAMKLFFAYLDRALAGGPLEEEFEAHLEACLSCCEKLAFSRQLDAFVKARCADVPVPNGLEPRVRHALARAATRL